MLRAVLSVSDLMSGIDSTRGKFCVVSHSCVTSTGYVAATFCRHSHNNNKLAERMLRRFTFKGFITCFVVTLTHEGWVGSVGGALDRKSRCNDTRSIPWHGKGFSSKNQVTVKIF